MRVMVIGSAGQLGSDLVKVLQKSDKEVIGLTHQEIEVLDKDSICRNIDAHQPNIVINTAAYHKVDEVENNPEKAFAINAIAPAMVARECARRDVACMFLSTDYVYGSDRERRAPYSETDLPGPINVYGASKLTGEMMVQYSCPKHYIVRTSGLYGERGASGKGGNFIETMLRLAREGKPIKVVNDQRLTPTSTVDLSVAINHLIETAYYGLYHITCEGDCTWYEFALKIFELCRLSPDVTPVLTREMNTTAVRPGYSVLSKERLYSRGITKMRFWVDALADYLRRKAASSNT